MDLFLVLASIYDEQNLDYYKYINCIKITTEEFRYLINNHYIKDVNCKIAYYKLLGYLREGSGGNFA